MLNSATDEIVERHTMNLIDLIVGKPLKTSDDRAEQIGPTEGIPIFGLDALASAAYGPEAALTLLIPLGLLGVRYIVPISLAIITLLIIVYFSYLQTIAAYPSGGGSYTVARFNLGAFPSLLAAAALMTDYILTAAVGISAGVGALISAASRLEPHTVSICVGILIVITVLNLRGVHDTGIAFMIPTYLFVGTLLILIVAGVIRVMASGGHPVPVMPLPAPSPATATVGLWLLFESLCERLHGSDGSGGCEQWGASVSRTGCEVCATHSDDNHIDSGRVACRNLFLVRAYGIVATDPGSRVTRACFRCCCWRFWEEWFLLCDDCFDSAGAFAIGQYCFRRSFHGSAARSHTTIIC